MRGRRRVGRCRSRWGKDEIMSLEFWFQISIQIISLLVVVVGGYLKLRITIERALSERPTWQDQEKSLEKLEKRLLGRIDDLEQRWMSDGIYMQEVKDLKSRTQQLEIRLRDLERIIDRRGISDGA
jgi:hypothetical protein